MKGSFSFFIRRLRDARVQAVLRVGVGQMLFSYWLLLDSRRLFTMLKKGGVFLWYRLIFIGSALFGYRLPREIFHRANRFKPPPVRESLQATVQGIVLFFWAFVSAVSFCCSHDRGKKHITQFSCYTGGSVYLLDTHRDLQNHSYKCHLHVELNMFHQLSLTLFVIGYLLINIYHLNNIIQSLSFDSMF